MEAKLQNLNIKNPYQMQILENEFEEQLENKQAIEDIIMIEIKMQKKQEEQAVKRILFSDFNSKIQSNEAKDVRNILNNFIMTDLSEII